MSKKQEIVKAAARLFANQGFDTTTTLEITRAAAVTEPALYYHFNGKDELFINIIESTFAEYFSRLETLKNHLSTHFEKIVHLIDIHFQFADEMPSEACLVISSCPAKLKDPENVCEKNIAKAREWLTAFLAGCLKDGILSGEFNEIPAETTVDLIIALINGLLRQHVLRHEHRDGMTDAAIEFCRRSLVKNAPG